jgi:hypothetical protein
MRFAKTAVFRFLSIVISVTLTVGVLLIGLKIFDAYLLSDRHAATPDDDADEPTRQKLRPLSMKISEHP